MFQIPQLMQLIPQYDDTWMEMQAYPFEVDL